MGDCADVAASGLVRAQRAGIPRADATKVLRYSVLQLQKGFRGYLQRLSFPRPLHISTAILLDAGQSSKPSTVNLRVHLTELPVAQNSKRPRAFPLV